MKGKAAVLGAMGSVFAAIGLSMAVGFGFRWGVEACEITFDMLDKAIDKGVEKYYDAKKNRKMKKCAKKLEEEEERTRKDFDA